MLSEQERLTRTIRKGGGAKVGEVAKRNRDWSDYACEVISICNMAEGQRKTHIMYGANLSFTVADELVFYLEQVGCIEGRDDKWGKVFHATEKGLRFLDLEQQQRHLLGLPEDEPTAKAVREQYEKNGFKVNNKKPRVDTTEVMVEISP